MPLKIVRNDIVNMQADVIVNTANEFPTVGTGCDSAIYAAAGYEELLEYRKKHIGQVPEGEVFATPAFGLQAKHIIHAVSPLFLDGESGEEEKLRNCYRRSLQMAQSMGAESIAFPLISTGGFGYPLEEGLRIAVDEINAFLMKYEMLVYLVVFGKRATRLGARLQPSLDSYIDQHYVEEAEREEYSFAMEEFSEERPARRLRNRRGFSSAPELLAAPTVSEPIKKIDPEDFEENYLKKLQERLKHSEDTFTEYMLYLMEEKQMEDSEVYKRACVNRQAFNKIRNNKDAHPKKLTVLQICMGLMLNLDQTKDLLAKAGYALTMSDKQDVFFSFFIENGIYDMIELDIRMEEYGLDCIIK